MNVKDHVPRMRIFRDDTKGWKSLFVCLYNHVHGRHATHEHLPKIQPGVVNLARSAQ
jgi:hypothetical protein